MDFAKPSLAPTPGVLGGWVVILLPSTYGLWHLLGLSGAQGYGECLATLQSEIKPGHATDSIPSWKEESSGDVLGFLEKWENHL